jgi:aldose 1-epimerase
VDVLHPYPEDVFDPVHWAKGGIYPLIPYSNRIDNARLSVGDEVLQLRAHPAAAPHTLHGNAQAQAWVAEPVDPAAANTALLRLDSPASDAWPWRYEATQQFLLRESSLTVTLTLTNRDHRAMPAGIGLHPYFRHHPHATVGYAAKDIWPTDAAFLPLGSARPLQNSERADPPRHLVDGTMTDYLGGWSGRASLELPSSPSGAVLTIEADAVFGHLVVHRPDSMAYLCLEPVSHVADGFNLADRGVANTGTHLLEPGGCISGAIRFALLDQVETRS